MQQLQDMINKRADERLENDIESLSKVFFNHNVFTALLDGQFINVGTSDKPNNTQIKWMFTKSTPLYEKIFKANVERYRSDETEKFLSEFEKLKDQYEQLTSDVQNISYNLPS